MSDENLLRTLYLGSIVMTGATLGAIYAGYVWPAITLVILSIVAGLSMIELADA